jgi:hypothetical protein
LLEQSHGRFVAEQQAIISRPDELRAQALAVQRQLHQRALQRAGIAAADWNSANGFAANREYARRVYDYYGRLYAIKPRQLLWAGLARLGGGEVLYPGFIVLNAIRRLVDGEVLPWLARMPFIRKLRATANPARLEQQLLQIQHDVFADMAWQHEACLEDRLDWLWLAWQGGLIRSCDFAAWRSIARNDSPEAIAAANKVLLRREQEYVIQPAYNTIAPNLQSDCRDVADKTMFKPGRSLSLLAVAIHHRMDSFLEQFPNGNVMCLDDRWQWIERHIYPGWIELHRKRPHVVDRLLHRPMPRNLAHALGKLAIIIIWEFIDGKAAA